MSSREKPNVDCVRSFVPNEKNLTMGCCVVGVVVVRHWVRWVRLSRIIATQSIHTIHRI